MFEFFNQVVGFFSSLFNYVSGIVESLFHAAVFLGNSIRFPTNLAGYMPSILSTAISCFFAVYALKFIAGK